MGFSDYPCDSEDIYQDIGDIYVTENSYTNDDLIEDEDVCMKYSNNDCKY